MIDLILAFITLLYLVQIGAGLLGLRRTKDRKLGTGTPFVTVVVAARDEEQDIPRCLESLAAQTYASDRYEVIIANDNSSDGTGRICDEFCRTHPNFTTFITQLDGPLKGKPNALAQAVDRSRGEIILITDADCVVPATWIEKTAMRYSPEVGMVGGVTVQKADTAFHGMQSLDWAYILGAASVSAALGNPLGSIGNNMSFRKEAYEQVGGYRKLRFSVTEDYTLVQGILGTKKWEFLYPIDPDILVESQPCPSLKALIQQKHRWGKGGLNMKVAGFFVMAIAFAMHAGILWSLFWYSIPVAGTMFLLKFIGDYAYLYRILSRLKRTEELKYFYWFELYYVLYVLVLPFLVFFGGKVSWKGRRY